MKKKKKTNIRDNDNKEINLSVRKNRGKCFSQIM